MEIMKKQADAIAKMPSDRLESLYQTVKAGAKDGQKNAMKPLQTKLSKQTDLPGIINKVVGDVIQEEMAKQDGLSEIERFF